MCDPPPTFGVIPWNSSAMTLPDGTLQEQEYFNRLGEIIYGPINREGREFRADVKFWTRQPGFIVQEIWRELIVDGAPLDRDLFNDSDQLEPNIHYWEIFYVSDQEETIFLSQVADSYLLGSEEANYPSGQYRIRGISTFYPLPSDFVLNYDQTGEKPTLPETLDILKGIFGHHVKFDGKSELGFGHAGGLPVSIDTTEERLGGAPTMGPLDHSYYQLVREVETSWQPDVLMQVNERFYYQRYDHPQITCMTYINRHELMPVPDTREKKKERKDLTKTFKAYLPQENQGKYINQGMADSFIEGMISDNYGDEAENGPVVVGGRKKKQTKRKKVKRKYTKKKKQKVYIKIG
jgi:hypothetical protein